MLMCTRFCVLNCALSYLLSLDLHIPNLYIKFNKSLWVFYNTEKEELKIKYPHSTKFDKVDKKLFSCIKQAERERERPETQVLEAPLLQRVLSWVSMLFKNEVASSKGFLRSDLYLDNISQ